MALLVTVSFQYVYGNDIDPENQDGLADLVAESVVESLGDPDFLRDNCEIAQFSAEAAAWRSIGAEDMGQATEKWRSAAGQIIAQIEAEDRTS
jgi:hypothetical protein